MRRDPGDIAGWVELAQRATGREEALRYLKQGLEANNSSEVYTEWPIPLYHNDVMLYTIDREIFMLKIIYVNFLFFFLWY